MTKLQGGRNICGVSIGVLSLDSHFPKPPGHIKNPSSLPFTTCYEILDGITVPELLHHPKEEMIERLREAARSLEGQGVRAITGSCGFLALFQRQIAEAVSIPVFLSSLIQLPMIHQMTRAPVGILTASAAALTERHLAGVGAAGVPVEIQGLEAAEEFAAVILRNERDDMDMDRIRAELFAATRALLDRAPGIRALVLECTDLPPHAHGLQQEFGLPIFDLTTLATMIDMAVRQQRYPGFT
ncbi:aspartate/glutamate racemase family protein [Limimaricola cinnabarinus]|uniref:aspartate/glutamate racemase family protein n=1 Tax=Limimaricola cinnabarinus TaxID=1125964 RepID=UPI00248F7BA8|nr:aspartate/glutamate racemase family protein [Limimaricola cinnabarinus]